MSNIGDETVWLWSDNYYEYVSDFSEEGDDKIKYYRADSIDEKIVKIDTQLATARNEALEEAAKIAHSVNNHSNPMTANDVGDEIRALKANTTT